MQDDESLTIGKVAVLIVRDSDERAAISELLESMGITVHHAKDSRETITTLEDNDCDFLVMEMQLPDKNGLAMLGSLRESVNLKSLPVLVISKESIVISLENVTTLTRPIALVRLRNVILSFFRSDNRI